MMKKMRWLLILLVSFISVACSANTSENSAEETGTEDSEATSTETIEETDEEKENTETQNIKLGTTAFFQDIAHFIREDFEKETGNTLEIELFNDFSAPNTGVEEGSLDVNLYQHYPFLEKFNESNDTNLKAFSTPGYFAPGFGLYSDKYDSIEDIPDNGHIILANDPTNMAYGLQVLEEAGLVELNDEEVPTTLDITDNPKNLSFTEMDSQQIYNSLPDADAGCTNSVAVLQNGGNPNEMLVGLPESVYQDTSIILGFNGDEDFPSWAQSLEDVILSDKTKDFIEENYEGAMINVR